MGFILMYDITNEESFNSVQDWITQIKNYSWDNAQVILVGNKCDMEEERVISTERGRQLAEQLGVRFFETSAKENINVKVCYTNPITDCLINKKCKFRISKNINPRLQCESFWPDPDKTLFFHIFGKTLAYIFGLTFNFIIEISLFVYRFKFCIVQRFI